MIERRSIERGSRLLLLVLALGCASATTLRAQDQDGFFNDDALQEIRLVMNSRDWQSLKARPTENTYYPADLSWNGVTVRNIGIRSRGGATRNGTKPGLRIDINRFVTDQEFLGLKSFSLDNMYSDTSLIRESVSMKMFGRMGLPASRESHARIFVNNEYAGAYVVIESVDRLFVERVYGPEEANVETGGYLFEYEWITPYYLDYPGPQLESYAARFKPQTRDTDSIANLFTPIEAMVQAINESTDDAFAAEVGQYLDLNQFMRYMAVDSFMVEWDGFAGYVGMNNFYLYRPRNGRSQLLPKDKDASLAFLDAPVTVRFDTNVLVRRAMEVPALRQAYLDGLRECVALAGEVAADDPRGWLEREVARQTALVTPAVADDPVYPVSFDEFLATSAALLEFAQVRPSYVDCQAGDMSNGSGNDSDPSAGCQAATARGARKLPKVQIAPAASSFVK